MLKNRTFIFIASVPWRYNWQRQHEWASRLAAHNKVVYLQPLGMNNHGPLKIIRKVLQKKQKGVFKHTLSPNIKHNLEFLSLFFIPWHNISMINRLNGWLLNRQIQKFTLAPKTQLIFWVCNPADTVISLLDRYPGSTVVYDIAMRFLKRDDCPKYLAASQNALARRADLILTDSQASIDDLPSVVTDKVHYVPQGVNLNIFNNRRRPTKKLSSFWGPKIIYLGANHDSIDRQIFEQILKNVPKAHLILTFNHDEESLQGKRMHYIGPIQFSEIPGLLAESDVGIIPYKINAFTQGVFPTKTFEYLAAGLPVVSSALPELAQFKDKIKIARSPREFSDLVQQALKERPRPVDHDFIVNQSWASRFATVNTELLKVLGQKQ